MRKYSHSRILVVDDNFANLELVKTMLEHSGYQNVACTADPENVLILVENLDPDLIILDLHMPRKGGLEVLTEIRETVKDEYLPVLVFTADGYAETRIKALAAGASDFLQKPGDFSEILLRVGNFLEMRALHCRFRDQSRLLEALVEERTSELEDARLELVEKLSRLSQARDDGCGEHPYRVASLAAEIATALRLPEDVVALIRTATPLHDLGKVGVPDALLLKQERLTQEEFELIKAHVNIGAGILANSRSPLLRIAEEIARTHHEHWDGSGYPDGLRGENIPIAGRIVALADVYDALVTERSYKQAWSHEDASEKIKSLSGTKFDPQVVYAFLTLSGKDNLEGLQEAA